MPEPQAPRAGWLRGLTVAHRGLHGGTAGLVENSLSAATAAIAAGHAIECDVHLAACGRAVVFHDATLDRLTAETGPVAARTAAELGAIPLRGGAGDTIPTLAQLLALVGGRVPLLIEIKADGPVAPLCQAVATALVDYRGAHAVMSFDPGVGAWFARHHADTPRGLVIDGADMHRRRRAWFRHWALIRARPDFLALDIRALPCPFARRQRARGRPIATWTVRTVWQHTIAIAHADAPIAEAGGFM